MRKSEIETGAIEGLRIVPAKTEDLACFLDLLEDLAAWLAKRGIKQWDVGSFRLSAGFYAGSIEREEVQLAFIGDKLVGALRLLLYEPIVWPEINTEDAVYVYNLAVRRAWAGCGLGRQLLEWVEARAVALGRSCVRHACLPKVVK